MALLSVLGAAGDHWVELLPLLADVSTTLTYGRPSLGGSDPLPPAARRPTGLLPAAEELRQVLYAISSPPWVLVTASVGAFVADRLTTAFPEEVAGLVLVDPTSSSPWPAEVPRDENLEDGDEGHVWSWKDCYVDLALPLLTPRPRTVVVSSSVGRWVRIPPKKPFGGPLSLQQVDDAWQAFQTDWAARYDAVHVIANTAGHFVHRDEPRLVHAAVKAVVEAARRGGAVDLSEQVVGHVGGYLAQQ